MKPDDELCLCFHVSKRKVLNFLRIEKPKSVSQLSECFGAGTGCGWCRGMLKRLFDQAIGSRDARAGDHARDDHGTGDHGIGDHGIGIEESEEPTAEQYAQDRSRYVRAGGGTPPPGATPVDD